jgi:O-antigen/teichoic acid export membrane protein
LKDGAQPRSGFSLRSIGSDAAVVIGGTFVANVFNYLYHFTISRRLGPEDYGTLATLAAAATIFGVFGGTVSVVAMQDTAKLWAEGREAGVAPFVRKVAPAAIGIGLVVGLLALMAGLAAGPYLHIVQPALWFTFATYLAIIVVSGFLRGAAGGAHRFRLFAFSAIIETVSKLVVALALVTAGFAVLGALGGFVAGGLAGVILIASRLALPRGDPKQADVHDHLELGGRALSVFWISASVLFLLFMDQLFAKHYLVGAGAGFYGAAGTIARTIPFGVGLLALVMGPKAAAAQHVSRESLRRLLGLWFGAGVALALFGITLTTFVPSQLLGITYGAKFVQAAPLLQLYGVAMGLFALVALGIAYLQAVRSYRATFALLTAVVIQAALMAWLGTTGARLLIIAIAVNIALLPAIAAYAVRTLHTAPQAPGPLVDEAELVQEPPLLT